MEKFKKAIKSYNLVHYNAGKKTVGDFRMKFGPINEIDQREKAMIKFLADMSATRGKRNTVLSGKVLIPPYILATENEEKNPLRRKRQQPAGIE